MRGFRARRESGGSGAVRSTGSAPRAGCRPPQRAPKELRPVRPRRSVCRRPERLAARPRNFRAGGSTFHGRPSPTGKNSRPSWSPEGPIGRARSIGGFSDPNRVSGRSGVGRSRWPRIPTRARPEGWSGVPERSRRARATEKPRGIAGSLSRSSWCWTLKVCDLQSQLINWIRASRKPMGPMPWRYSLEAGVGNRDFLPGETLVRFGALEPRV